MQNLKYFSKVQDLDYLSCDVQNLLGRSDFSLDTGSQSFVVYPTNHIEIMFDHTSVSIEIGTIIYGSIDLYNQVLNDTLADLANNMIQLANELGDHVSLNVVLNTDKPFNLSVGGLRYDVETTHHQTIQDVILVCQTFNFDQLVEL